MNEKITAMRDELAGKILAIIDSGQVKNWLKEWRAQDAPYNAVSKENYRGINNLYLSTRNHSDPRYMTFKQAGDRGYKVKKGSKSYQVEKWTFFTGAKDGAGTATPKSEVTAVTVRYFNVFNAEQIEGIPALDADEPREIKTIERAEQIINGCPITTGHGGARAYYTPATDCIQMPKRESFFNDMAYYGTLFHEYAHGTGHHTRLDREKGNRFGSRGYAYEELIAEFAAAFVSKEIGLHTDADEYERHLTNHAAYIKGWSEAKLNATQVLEAISAANKAASMVINWGVYP
jgi:antirestriction protein ArdC